MTPNEIAFYQAGVLVALAAALPGDTDELLEKLANKLTECANTPSETVNQAFLTTAHFVVSTEL